MISLLSTRCSNIFVGSIKSRWFWKELLDTRRAWFLISNISAISTTNSLQWPNKNSSRHLIWTICKRLCRSLFCFSHRKSHFLIILASDGQLRISNLWNFRKRSYKISRIRASCVSRSFRKARIRSHGPYGRGCWQRYARTLVYKAWPPHARTLGSGIASCRRTSQEKAARLCCWKERQRSSYFA